MLVPEQPPSSARPYRDGDLCQRWLGARSHEPVVSTRAADSAQANGRMPLLGASEQSLGIEGTALLCCRRPRSQVIAKNRKSGDLTMLVAAEDQ
jgi:hypothetical protein